MTTAIYDYLWDGSDEGWVLIRSRRSLQPVIFNLVTRSALTIEDDDVYTAVVDAMIANGKEVLDAMPPSADD